MFHCLVGLCENIQRGRVPRKSVGFGVELTFRKEFGLASSAITVRESNATGIHRPVVSKAATTSSNLQPSMITMSYRWTRPLTSCSSSLPGVVPPGDEVFPGVNPCCVPGIPGVGVERPGRIEYAPPGQFVADARQRRPRSHVEPFPGCGDPSWAVPSICQPSIAIGHAAITVPPQNAARMIARRALTRISHHCLTASPVTRDDRRTRTQVQGCRPACQAPARSNAG